MHLRHTCGAKPSDSSAKNGKNLLQALEEFGFGSPDIFEKDFSRDSMLQLGYEPNRIDLLTDISGVKFGPAGKNRIKASYGNQRSYYISLDDLMANKKASNRSKDKGDLELLENLSRIEINVLISLSACRAIKPVGPKVSRCTTGISKEITELEESHTGRLYAKGAELKKCILIKLH